MQPAFTCKTVPQNGRKSRFQIVAIFLPSETERKTGKSDGEHVKFTLQLPTAIKMFELFEH